MEATTLVDQQVPQDLNERIVNYVIAPDGTGQDPYADYARLRSLAPVHQLQPGIWVVSAHEPYTSLIRDPRLSRHEAAKLELGDPDTAPAEMRQTFAAVALMMINQDAPNHTRIRNLVRTAFMPSYVNSWQERVDVIARRVVDRALKLEEFDFIEDPMGSLRSARRSVRRAITPGDSHALDPAMSR